MDLDPAGRRPAVIAIDGKTVRGARAGGAVAPHLVAAFDHTAAVVLGQVAVAAKSNVIPTVRTLLSSLELTAGLAGAVVTIDAMHTQDDTATRITDAGCDYVFTVKNNRPKLRAALKALPWKHVPAYSYTQQTKGRRVRRTLKVAAVPAWITFPGAAQVAQLRRTVTTGGTTTVEVVYVVTSADVDPATLAIWIQGTGRSRTSCTTSATSPTQKMPHASAPATAPKSWPPCATPRSACYA